MARELVDKIVPSQWDSQKPAPASGTQRVRWLQNVTDLLRRPIANRLTVSTSSTAVTTTGSAVSTGIGIGPIQPKRYAEFTVKARITFNFSVSQPVYVYVYRTTGAIPTNGSAPNAGDVVVGGDAFFGGSVTAATNYAGTFSFLDTGLGDSTNYRYYFAVNGANGQTFNLINSSQLLVMERS